MIDSMTVYRPVISKKVTPFESILGRLLSLVQKKTKRKGTKGKRQKSGLHNNDGRYHLKRRDTLPACISIIFRHSVY